MTPAGEGGLRIESSSVLVEAHTIRPSHGGGSKHEEATLSVSFGAIKVATRDSHH